MSSEHLLLVMTAALAVVALGAAFVAVRATRRLRVEPAPESAAAPTRAARTDIVPARSAPVAAEGVAKIVDGRVIVAPTSRQVVDATLGRPLVRVSVISHGLAHALRPESRDRIIALMRREFQSRRRQRKRAAKQAARLEHPTPPRSIDQSSAITEAWLGELPTSHLSTYNRAVES